MPQNQPSAILARFIRFQTLRQIGGHTARHAVGSTIALSFSLAVAQAAPSPTPRDQPGIAAPAVNARGLDEGSPAFGADGQNTTATALSRSFKNPTGGKPAPVVRNATGKDGELPHTAKTAE